MAEPRARVGLIAGQGRLPLLVAGGMKAAGERVCCVGLRDQFEASLPGMCEEFSQAGIVQLGRWIRLLRRSSVREAVMVGRVAKVRMHDPWRVVRHIGLLPDWRAIHLWYRRLRHDRRTAAILTAVAEELASSGITLIDSTTHIKDHLGTPGVMGRVRPTAQQGADIVFGWPLLTRVVELGVGQSLAVRDRDVVAVEAVEGTGAMIARAGELCRARGWTLLKTAAPDHDMRFDVPSIGVETIEQVARAGGGCIALGAGRVILIDKPAVIAAADQMGVALVGMD